MIPLVWDKIQEDDDEVEDDNNSGSGYNCNFVVGYRLYPFQNLVSAGTSYIHRPSTLHLQPSRVINV